MEPIFSLSFPAIALPLALAFLLGSIPTGYVLGRLRGVDLRKEGSGNIGATNATRILGKRAGLYTFVGDVAKGIGGACLGFLAPAEAQDALRALCGFSAVVGHCYSPFLRFRGGKGVATGAGVFMMIAPLPMLVALASFVAVVKTLRVVSLGSLLAAALFTALVFAGVPEQYSAVTRYTALVTALLILLRHRSNIERLLHRNELNPGKQP